MNAYALHHQNVQVVTNARTAWALVGFSAMMLVVFLAAAMLDTRTLEGVSVWTKPAKFAISFIVLFATLALALERLSPSVKERSLLRWTLAALVVATWFELFYIGAQAGRGLTSHFNVATPFEAKMYALMGVGSVTLVAGIAIIGWQVGRDGGVRMGPQLRSGVHIGFWVSAVATLIIAGYMSGQPGHFIGTPPANAAVIPFTGWSAAVGDLRPAHFLALHAMQLLPLLGIWLDRKQVESTKPMRIAAIVYVMLCAALFVQALMGLPVIRL
jgi:hypothetical protein